MLKLLISLGVGVSVCQAAAIAAASAVATTAAAAEALATTVEAPAAVAPAAVASSAPKSLEIRASRLRELLEARNYRIQALRYLVGAAEVREGFLGRSFFPKFQAHVGAEMFRHGLGDFKSDFNYGIDMSVNLFNGGQDQLENQIRSAMTERRKSESTRITSDELGRARASYWNFLFERERLEILKKSLVVNRENQKTAERRIKSGVATESDRVEFEMKQVDLVREQASAEVKIRVETQNLRVLLGMDHSIELVFPESIVHEHEYEAELRHTADDHAFLYKETEIQARVSGLEASKQRQALWPKVEAYAAYGRASERAASPSLNAEDRQETVVGLRVVLPLTESYEARHEAAAFENEAQAAQMTAQLLRTEAEAHIHNELAELQLLHDQVHDAEKNIERAERYYRLTQSEYQRGVKNSPDVLGASEKLLETRLKRLEMVRDFQLAKTHVLAKLGR